MDDLHNEKKVEAPKTVENSFEKLPFVQKVMKIQNIKRFNNMYSVTPRKLFLSSLTDNRIHMNRINRLNIRIFVYYPSYGSEHLVHRFT